MNGEKILKSIKEIIFSVPGEIYKYEEPDNCFDEEWTEASAQEKAFMLVEDLLINSNREEMNKKQETKDILLEIKLDIIPTFYSIADENMFFNAMYSVPSIKDIKGSGRALYLYCVKSMTNEEKDFLVGLFKRYEVPVPSEIQ
jgi:hypothetical protein